MLLNILYLTNIFCLFHLNNFIFSGSEIRVGSIDVKSSAVHFYVGRTNIYTTGSSIIPFQVEHLNVGGGMNLSTGVFTVPVDGVYHFEYSGMKDSSASKLIIQLQVNGTALGRAETNPFASGNYYSLSLTVSLQLKKYDRVNLFNEYGALYDYGTFHTQFAGWLVEEDLQI